MGRTYPTFKDWAVAFENTAAALLADHVTHENYLSYRVYAAPCPKHGRECALAVYGCLLDHIAWAAEAPGLSAERMVATLLPPPAQSFLKVKGPVVAREKASRTEPARKGPPATAPP